MIFVTGGTGLLGNWIVRELCSRGEPVRALCRSGTSREPFADLDVEIVDGDLGDAERLRGYVAGCRAVIHSAAYIHIGWQNLEESREVNVEGTKRLSAACLTEGARLVHVSTVDTLPAAKSEAEPIDESGLDGVQKTPCSYVISKTEAEQVVRQLLANTELDAVIVHPGFMLAPNDWKPSSGRMLLEVRKAPLVLAPSGGCSACDARDVAAAIVNALELGQRGRNYILAGQNLTYKALFGEMLLASGQQRRVRSLGPLAGVAATCIDAANRLLHLKEGDVNGATIAMASLLHYYSSERARSELKYATRPLRETLGDTWEWFSQRK